MTSAAMTNPNDMDDFEVRYRMLEAHFAGRITVKSLKVSDLMSEETLAYEATVYLDSKKVAVCHNRGCGGMTGVWPAKNGRAAFEKWKAFEAEVDAKAKELGIDYAEPSGLIDSVACRTHQDRKDKRATATKVIWTVNGETFQVKSKPYAVRWREFPAEARRSFINLGVTRGWFKPTDDIVFINDKFANNK